MNDERHVNRALNRNEALVTQLLDITNRIPNIFPLKGGIQEQLNNLRSAMQGLRPPRIMVIGRSRSGKSSLINAICGLKVSEVSDTVPETGAAEWKNYYHSGTDLLHILDTRGLQESQSPRQADPANTPYESIMRAVKKECPDVVLFLCKATEVHAALQEDLNICASILTEIERIYKRQLPVIGVLTKCDELAPPGIFLPTENERKNRNIAEQLQSFHTYLNTGLRGKVGFQHCIKNVVPTVSYAEYEDGQNGLILPDGDRRWNIDKLVEEMIRCTPREVRGSIARMANLKDFQKTVARTIVVACTILCGFVSANPIPGAALPIVGMIQTFMVMYIGWLSGREFSEETVQDFIVNGAVAAGANAGMIGLADIALKAVPGLGNILAAGAGAIATQGLGDSAIVYFLKEPEKAKA